WVWSLFGPVASNLVDSCGGITVGCMDDEPQSCRGDRLGQLVHLPREAISAVRNHLAPPLIGLQMNAVVPYSLGVGPHLGGLIVLAQKITRERNLDSRKLLRILP